MRPHSLTTYGFWLLLGFAGGMLVSDLAEPRRAYGTTSNRYEEFVMATGNSEDTQVDLVWLLDYDMATLSCISLANNGLFAGKSEVDLQNVFKGVKSPHFILVTGTLRNFTISDIVYIAETTSGRVIAVAAPKLNNQLAPIERPKVLDIMPFRDGK